MYFAGIIGLVMSIFGKKSLLRLPDIIELFCLYLGGFALVVLLLYLEHSSNQSYVLVRYFRFLLEYQKAFVIGYSMVVVVFHYQSLVKTRTEIQCKILVGDRLSLIRLRYFAHCMIILLSCFVVFIMVDSALGFSLVNGFYLCAVFIVYVFASALLLGRVRYS